MHKLRVVTFSAGPFIPATESPFKNRLLHWVNTIIKFVAQGYTMESRKEPPDEEALRRQIRQLEETLRDLKKSHRALEAEVRQKAAELERSQEGLKKLSRIKSDFTSTVSHELRAPLCVIKEGISLMLSGIGGPITEDQRETLTITNNHLDRLVRLINNVLDFSKMESGQIRVFFEKTMLNNLVQEIHDLMKPAAAKKQLDFALNLPAENVEIICDADKIKQILINMVDNAIKFTEAKGQISLGLGLDQQKGNVCIKIEDTGVGIPQQDQKKIFEMFEQSSEQTALRAGGAGVGLAICKKYMELHSGEIRVESIVGQGSKFILFFPNNLESLRV